MNKTPPAGPESAEILLYQTEDGQTRLEVRLQDETVWLTQKRMAELFQKDVRTINEHIKNIFKEGELKSESVIRNFRITADQNTIIMYLKKKNCRRTNYPETPDSSTACS